MEKDVVVKEWAVHVALEKQKGRVAILPIEDIIEDARKNPSLRHGRAKIPSRFFHQEIKGERCTTIYNSVSMRMFGSALNAKSLIAKTAAKSGKGLA